jgi:hypothetical protein
MPGRSSIVLSLALFGLLFASCDRDREIETTVYEDGRIERTITSSVNAKGNNQIYFTLEDLKAWKNDSIVADSPNYKYTFSKNFSSAEEANLTFAPALSDTIFKIRSTFIKEFRWFYTYYYFSDSYLPVNRFRKVIPEDFFTQEDYAFIDRLPMAGKELSRSDELFLEKLNNKVSEDFFSAAYYAESFDDLMDALRENNVDTTIIDTLNIYKNAFYARITDDTENEEDDKQNEDKYFMLKMLDVIKDPLPREDIRKSFIRINGNLLERADFMMNAANTNFIHRINTEWITTETNADSISGKTLVWKPRNVKFYFRDYEMYATGKKINWWTTLGTLGLLFGVVIISFVIRYKQ